MKDLLLQQQEVILKIWETYDYFERIMSGDEIEGTFTVIFPTYLLCKDPRLQTVISISEAHL